MSVLKKEIFEQPQVIQTLLDVETDNIAHISQSIFFLSVKLVSFNHLLLEYYI